MWRSSYGYTLPRPVVPKRAMAPSLWLGVHGSGHRIVPCVPHIVPSCFAGAFHSFVFLSLTTIVCVCV